MNVNEAKLIPPKAAQIKALRWELGGRVQGVGYRPFAYTLARAYGIRGFVRNDAGRVVVVGEGREHDLARFGEALLSDAPSLARPRLLSCTEEVFAGWTEFRVEASRSNTESDVHLPPDCFCCDDCLQELTDPRNHRYRYPFINCTQCGPRYTLITHLPYDRASTSMAGFAMCLQCRAEYDDPGDRRFHAEPIACPDCGPRLSFHASGSKATCSGDSMNACVAQLREGKIVAVKGVGGYHLMVDATDAAAITRLRERKRRPHKPLAVMFPMHDDGKWLEQSLALDASSREALFSPLRPVVLVRGRPGSRLPPIISPGLKDVGAMLPYSPLHHLLLRDFGKPLVATSANLSGEPVLTDAFQVEARLGEVADYFLHHDRDIVRPADDSVLRVVAGQARPVRLGRGAAPIEVGLSNALPRPVLALGSQMKNTVALGWGRRAVVTPHIGDLDSPRALVVFEQAIADMQRLYGVKPESVACDTHPGYAGTRWANACGLPLHKVLHHHAHASALAGEHPNVRHWLVFTWDGVGLGEDGTLWGGEGFLGRPGQWQRVTTLRPFFLPGGERAAREPWRSAAALCWEAGLAWRTNEHALVHQAWRRRINCPQTSSVGRLFDAAACMIGLLESASYEGQAPMWLESVAGAVSASAISLPLKKDAGGIWQLDWAPLLTMLRDSSLPVEIRAASFHASLAQALLAQARAVREEHGVCHVGLCGGVFQNRCLAEQAVSLLNRQGFDVFLPLCLPSNDAALAYGQLVEAGARQ